MCTDIEVKTVVVVDVHITQVHTHEYTMYMYMYAQQLYTIVFTMGSNMSYYVYIAAHSQLEKVARVAYMIK